MKSASFLTHFKSDSKKMLDCLVSIVASLNAGPLTKGRPKTWTIARERVSQSHLRGLEILYYYFFFFPPFGIIKCVMKIHTNKNGCLLLKDCHKGHLVKSLFKFHRRNPPLPCLGISQPLLERTSSIVVSKIKRTFCRRPCLARKDALKVTHREIRYAHRLLFM